MIAALVLVKGCTGTCTRRCLWRRGALPYSAAAMRRLGLLIAAACPLALAACGGSSSPATKPPVRLSVDAPGDGAVVRAGTVEISGRVSPAGASVTVLGRSAAIAGETFSASVPLAAGDNVIDVMATGPSSRPAMTAVRILREITIRCRT